MWRCLMWGGRRFGGIKSYGVRSVGGMMSSNGSFKTAMDRKRAGMLVRCGSRKLRRRVGFNERRRRPLRIRGSMFGGG